MRKRKNTAYKYKYEFEEISNEIEAYALGLFYSDGSVGIRTYGKSIQSSACVHLIPEDIEVLNKINNYISNDTSVTCTEKVCMIRFYNHTLTNNLISLGCKQNKTYTGVNLYNIRKDLQRHMLRGIFDGDGSIVIDRSAQKKYPKSKV